MTADQDDAFEICLPASRRARGGDVVAFIDHVPGVDVRANDGDSSSTCQCGWLARKRPTDHPIDDDLAPTGRHAQRGEPDKG
jgi:hypothetical protein